MVFYPFCFCPLRTVGGGGVLNGQNPLSVTKVIYWQSLIFNSESKLSLLRHNFSQFIHRFKISSPIQKRDGKLGFSKSKPRFHFQISPNSLKRLKIEIFVHLQQDMPSYFVKWWGWYCSTTCLAFDREEKPIIFD